MSRSLLTLAELQAEYRAHRLDTAQYLAAFDDVNRRHQTTDRIRGGVFGGMAVGLGITALIVPRIAWPFGFSSTWRL
ncbi:hypothetical protein TPY_2742 [Sulfobacillus acidophilus TPY]|uniref:Uncharacterized protein n=1 Tax=Sulfobacillus acidophilus (strain ATCC 700253 / DSM 10332 / NAL) TaxID=679936 RepID=G8TUJ1_SULAD|nr:hypothetical protein TPY_2742 [Sulfobacillus acidophilus TPY]AEW04638.1 hypothetical protein Sulac_1138 [Sulfobacillus acidophilus DSM 10332]